MEGYQTLMIKVNDTDVVVIAISILPSLQELGLQKLWIAFGQGKHLKWIPIHDIVSAIGPEKTSGILSANLASIHQQLDMRRTRRNLSLQCMIGPVLLNVWMMHDWSSSLVSRDLINQSHTRAALMQHLKRSAYQAGCLWSQPTVCQPETLSPADWGWTKEADIWKTCWTTLPPIATSCQELTKCGCKMECRGNCKCYCFNLACIALCSCTCLD